MLTGLQLPDLLSLQATSVSALYSAPDLTLSGASSASLLPSMGGYYHGSRECQPERFLGRSPYDPLFIKVLRGWAGGTMSPIGRLFTSCSNLSRFCVEIRNISMGRARASLVSPNASSVLKRVAGRPVS